MFVELAIGDAYGAGFEYVNRQLIRQYNNLSGYIQHPRHATKPGEYTDDTQMSIAIAEAIINHDDWTPIALAKRFVEAFKRDPREGYASSFYAFLKQVSDEHEFLAKIVPESDKSGAAMRASPIGIFPKIAEVIHKANLQASITHNTPDGINAAVAAALMSHYFIYKIGEKSQLGAFIEKHVPGNWADEWHGQVGPKGWMSVKAAITAIHQHAGMSAILKACIDYSGDVDTVATIALAAASYSYEIKQDLPDVLHSILKRSVFGYDYLMNLDQQFTDRILD